MLEVLFALSLLFPSSSFLFTFVFPIFTSFSPGTIPSLSYISGVGKFRSWFVPLGSPQQMVELFPDASLFVLQVINPALALPVPPVIPI